ncbi:hypothetical protein [Ferruginibacter sp. HRS2-29]|nr:hypothetical protein [Ferruginibacter sp. HRS2-29]
MKKNYLFARFYSVSPFTLQTIHVSTQNAAINTDGSAPDASSALDQKSI